MQYLPLFSDRLPRDHQHYLMKTIFLCLILCLAASPAWAKLGDTEAQCVAQYGPILATNTMNANGLAMRVLIFRKDGVRFTVALMHNKEVGLTIKKEDHSEFTDKEIQLFLDSDSTNQEWTKSNELTINWVWVRGDGSGCSYDVVKHTLTFATKEVIDAEAAPAK